jgi:hypothetical protein
LFTCEYQSLLIGRNSFFVLNLGLNREKMPVTPHRKTPPLELKALVTICKEKNGKPVYVYETGYVQVQEVNGEQLQANFGIDAVEDPFVTYSYLPHRFMIIEVFTYDRSLARENVSDADWTDTFDYSDGRQQRFEKKFGPDQTLSLIVDKNCFQNFPGVTTLNVVMEINMNMTDFQLLVRACNARDALDYI